MKESDITPEVIAKAKEIAKYWRMEIYKGSWALLKTSKYRWKKVLVEGQMSLDMLRGYQSKEMIPIPSISDCLEKLLELGYESMNLQRRPFKNLWGVNLWDTESHKLEENTISRWRREDKTLHLALLSTLLEVLTK